MAGQTDLTMMSATHDALRRDLDDIARITARQDDDPKSVLRSAVGWQLFTSFLHVHHSAEDDLLWPAMRRSLTGDSAGQALLDAMEAEHAGIDPLLVAIDAALVDGESGPKPLAELTDSLASSLRAHLDRGGRRPAADRRHRQRTGVARVRSGDRQARRAGYPAVLPLGARGRET